MKEPPTPTLMLRTNSLAFRIGAIAAGWSLLGLIVGSYVLSSLFRDSVERSFDNQVVSDLESVITVAELACDGMVTMPRPLVANRFRVAFSGSYWQVESFEVINGRPRQRVRSESLEDHVLNLSSLPLSGVMRLWYAPGPSGQSLRLGGRIISLPPAEETPGGTPCRGGRFRIAAAADLADVEGEIAYFDTFLFWSLAVMAAGLIGLTVTLVQVGLAPLGQVSQSLAAIREGRAAKLEGKLPAEVEPLAEELNALVAHNAEVVARARTHVANLAHFLKTPLSVIANEVQGTPGSMAETIGRQVQVMRRQVDHYLARARTAASAKVIGARTEAAAVMTDLTRALSKIYAARGIRIERQVGEKLFFRGDRSDFEEMVGNLIDNACKWAEGEVNIAVRAGGPGRLIVAVSDDGPGLTDEQVVRVLEKGERLDQSKPGSGLGVGIVKEIAQLYGGTLTLGRAEAGGLLAVLDLPAVERAG
jgi:signal transduction histidine kinase